MSEIDEPLPREHAACIVRASEVMVKIMDIQQQVADLNLMGIAAAASTKEAPRAARGQGVNPPTKKTNAKKSSNFGQSDCQSHRSGFLHVTQSLPVPRNAHLRPFQSQQNVESSIYVRLYFNIEPPSEDVEVEVQIGSPALLSGLDQ